MLRAIKANSQEETQGRPQEGRTSRLEVGNPHEARRITKTSSPAEAVAEGMSAMPTVRTGSLKTTPPRRLRRPQVSSSLVQELDRVFTQRPQEVGQSLKNGALNRESDARGRRRQSTGASPARAYT
jgi:hypothetical protein